MLKCMEISLRKKETDFFFLDPVNIQSIQSIFLEHTYLALVCVYKF